MILDSEGGDAPGGIEHPRLRQGTGGAGVEAGGAGAAVIGFERQVGRKQNVGQEGLEQEVAAGSRIDEHRVLAKPAQSGKPAIVAFGERRRIDHASGVASRHPRFEPGREVVEPVAERGVVVVTPGIPGDATGPSGQRLTLERLSAAVIGGQHHDALHARQHRGRIPSQRFMAAEPVAHHAGQTGRNPPRQGLMMGWCNSRRHTQPAEAEAARLDPDLSDEVAAVGRGRLETRPRQIRRYTGWTG